ncbi:hypothetical protein DFH11DRAFT_1500682 [Phellopilus nigrolimitatus]|nr:hypothetical protein DFH11DRAFT_1500682 [Phellopilus nigrolimitatus]
MSDPSIIDPHLMRDQALRSSRISASSYYPAKTDPRGFSRKVSSGILSSRGSAERRKSSGESRQSKEIDLTLSDVGTDSMPRSPADLQPRDHRHSDMAIPAVPKMTASMLMSVQRPNLRKSPSANATMVNTTGLKSNSRTASPASNRGPDERGSDSVGSHVVEEQGGIDRITDLRNSDVPGTDISPSSSTARLSPSMGTRLKSASVSNGSLSGSSSGGRQSSRASPSIVTSFSTSTASLTRNMSIMSGGSGSAIGSVPGSIQRQTSTTRLRAVPPSRNPPPLSNLPPTPGSRPPSPLTFRSPRNASSSSLSPYSPVIDDPSSILMFDLPPSTPSSESASSASLCFAQPAQNSQYGEVDLSGAMSPRSGRRDVRSNIRSPTNVRMHKEDLRFQRPAVQPLHGPKSSVSSSNTLMSAFGVGVRGDTPTQRSLRKSSSQQSISGSFGIHFERQRVDSEASITSTTMMSEESSSSMFGSVGRSLRKQRSMHNTRAQGGTLAIPPLPQQLRHANSFNMASEASGSGQSHVKGDSSSSNVGSQRRPTTSSTPVSTANSIVSTPTTPQHKKRLLFSSHGRDRRDSNAASGNAERERQESAGGVHSIDVQHGDRKKTHSIGLGLFAGHFSPSGSSSHNSSEYNHEPRRISSPPIDDPYGPAYPPRSPVSTPPPPNVIDQHILPPKELLSQMEALADTEAPPSPPQFASSELESELEDEWSWGGSSSATGDVQSRSRVTSSSGMSVTFGQADEIGMISKSDPSSPSSMTRRFMGATESIHGRLHNERPSTASRLPLRSFSGHSTSSSTRPSTAEAPSPIRSSLTKDDASTDPYFVPNALPPPPRRKGAAKSSRISDRLERDEQAIVKPLSPPPSSHSSTRLQRLPSYENTGLKRLPSHETISTYNPNRGSIFRKPSFLNIDDDFAETASNVGAMSSVPEDSFLILEHGKDSLDIGRTFDELSDGL